MLSDELNSALDDFAKFKIFDVVNIQVKIKVETIYVPDFSVVRPAFVEDGSLGNLEDGRSFTLIPQPDGSLSHALRNLYQAMNGLTKPSYTMHTFHARVDHILDVARVLFQKRSFVQVTKLEELQWLVYPFSRRQANGKFENVDVSVLGDMYDSVVDMEGASEVEATGLLSDE